MRLLKVAAYTVVGFFLVLLGVVLLIAGIASVQPFYILGGLVSIAIPARWVIFAFVDSYRQIRRQEEIAEAHRDRGRGWCAICQLDFDPASSKKKRFPWHHFAVEMAFIVIGLIAYLIKDLFTVADLWDDVDGSWVSLLLLAGICLLLGKCLYDIFEGMKAIRSTNADAKRVYLLCPTCGNACGFADDVSMGNVKQKQ